jgi:hypothetical protein
VKRFGAIVLTAVGMLAAAVPAGAGAIGPVLEAPTEGALALAVSRAEFPDGSAPDVVVTDTDDVALAAMAAAFTGLLPGRAPLLFEGPGAAEPALRAEIARVTGGPGSADPPQVWLFGTSLSGLDGYDVRSMGDTVASAAGAIIDEGAGAGTGDRLILFAADDRAAAAVAAGFGAVAGVPALALGALPDGVSAARAIAIGSVAVPSGVFAEPVTRVEGGDPAALSAAAATALGLQERPAGAPVALPVRPVAADGYGTSAVPSLLAAVVAAGNRDRGALAPVLLVDGRPAPDLAGGCSGAGRDKASLCVLAQADGETTVLVLGVQAARAAQAERLPATGAAGTPAGAALVLSLFFILRRRPA